MGLSHMEVARSGLTNGLKLKLILMGEGEIKRLWCSEPDLAPPGKLSGLGKLKSHPLRTVACKFKSAMIPTGFWPCPDLQKSAANNSLEQAWRDKGLGLRAGALSTSAQPHTGRQASLVRRRYLFDRRASFVLRLTRIRRSVRVAMLHGHHALHGNLASKGKKVVTSSAIPLHRSN